MPVLFSREELMDIIRRAFNQYPRLSRSVAGSIFAGGYLLIATNNYQFQTEQAAVQQGAVLEAYVKGKSIVCGTGKPFTQDEIAPGGGLDAQVRAMIMVPENSWRPLDRCREATVVDAFEAGQPILCSGSDKPFTKAEFIQQGGGAEDFIRLKMIENSCRIFSPKP